MKKNKILSCVLGIMLATMTVFSVGIMCVSANNHTDTTFSFNFSGTPYEGMYKTDFRQKTDTTSSYMKCQYTAIRYNAYVCGADNDCYEYYDASRGYSYDFLTNVICYMRNWVHEDGYDLAGIEAMPRNTNSGTARGVWSPDSVR